ncbi:MAG TPA: hypothetical protein VGQ13_00170 [Nitrososphaera sp.]|jgi:hypothetical protein|nr:hypothetical protein [Nitrososphaera sp.]
MSFRNAIHLRVGSGAPKNEQERTVTDRDGAAHLEFFMNGSWRHSTARCKLRVNKACNK